MKFRFTATEYTEKPDFGDDCDFHVDMEFDALTYHEVLEKFDMFLRGAGFVFDGDVDIVNDQSEDEQTTFAGIHIDDPWEASDTVYLSDTWPYHIEAKKK